jgi:ABC-2 type transport system ATP-binding protein
VTDPPDANGNELLANALAARGLTVQREGRLLFLDIADERTYDLVRDQVADLGLGLIRLEQQRHHMAELFRPEEGGA